MPERSTYYHGKRWDAPMMDDAEEMNHEFWELVITVGTAKTGTFDCDICEEPMTEDDNIHVTPYLQCHTECEIRSVMGDVAHLEGRCSCPIAGTVVADRHTPEEEAQTYRESAIAAVQWLIDHNRGRWVSPEGTA